MTNDIKAKGNQQGGNKDQQNPHNPNQGGGQQRGSYQGGQGGQNPQNPGEKKQDDKGGQGGKTW